MDRWQHTGPQSRDLGAPLKNRNRQARGSSLIELLASILFVSILGAMSHSFARAALVSARTLLIKCEAEERTLMALDMMARELRMAAFNAAGPTAPTWAGVRIATSDHVEVACDLDGNGSIADSNEIIAYSYDANGHSLMRASGGGSPQPFVRDVPSSGLQISYVDTNGTPIASTAGNLTTTDRRRIHRMDLRLTVSLPNPDPQSTTPLVSTASTSVCLRNQ